MSIASADHAETLSQDAEFDLEGPEPVVVEDWFEILFRFLDRLVTLPPSLATVAISSQAVPR